MQSLLKMHACMVFTVHYTAELLFYIVVLSKFSAAIRWSSGSTTAYKLKGSEFDSRQKLTSFFLFFFFLLCLADAVQQTPLHHGLV